MPTKRKSRMPTVRRKASRPYTRKTATTNKSSLVRLIKKVTLKTQETKMCTFTNQHTMLHNVSVRADQNLLASQQGITDTTGYANRLGDSVTPVGVKLYLQFRQPADRPNVNWKIWIVRTPGANSYANVPVKTITGNLMLDPLDTEQCNAVKVLYVKSPTSYFNGTLASSKEMNFFRTLYIPLNRQQYSYGADNIGLGKQYNIAMYAACYDTTGTLLTDIIGTFTWSKVFYFKDA